MRALFPLLLAIAPGCYATVELGGGSSDPDSDGDGLTDAREAELGSDPKLADTDGDTYNDGDEVTANADPLDPDHHPYIGGWPIGACRTEVAATGKAEGDIDDNFALLDQFGESVHLYDFCDKTVYLLYAAFW